jgi:phosphoglycerate dehydrogenase-like enzyme
MQKEPVDQGNILLSLPQVLITPHVAGATDNPKMTHNNNWCCESEARDQGHSAPTKV